MGKQNSAYRSMASVFVAIVSTAGRTNFYY